MDRTRWLESWAAANSASRSDALRLDYAFENRHGRALFHRMEPTDEEKRQARRVQLLLYWLVAVMIGVPLVIFILRLR